MLPVNSINLRRIAFSLILLISAFAGIAIGAEDTFFPISGQIEDILLDETRDRFWLLRKTDGKVEAYDINTGSLLLSFPVGGEPESFAMTHDKKYLGAGQDNYLTVIDLENDIALPLVATINLEPIFRIAPIGESDLIFITEGSGGGSPPRGGRIHVWRPDLDEPVFFDRENGRENFIYGFPPSDLFMVSAWGYSQGGYALMRYNRGADSLAHLGELFTGTFHGDSTMYGFDTTNSQMCLYDHITRVDAAEEEFDFQGRLPLTQRYTEVVFDPSDANRAIISPQYATALDVWDLDGLQPLRSIPLPDSLTWWGKAEIDGSGQTVYAVVTGSPSGGVVVADLNQDTGEKVFCPATGHYYEFVDVAGGINWRQAKAAAERRSFLGAPGHLATVTSQEENDFIVNEMFLQTEFTQTCLGGFQQQGSSEPDGGWQWVTGEPWSFTNWNLAQPDNDLQRTEYENALEVHYSDGTWNDIHFSEFRFRYLVEYETVNVAAVDPLPYSTATLLEGATVYGDRDYTFTAPIRSGLEGLTFIRTNNDDKSSTTSDFLEFDIDQPSVVYIAYDPRIQPAPAWLAAWDKTDDTLMTTDLGQPVRDLYSKRFPAGTVILGGNQIPGTFNPESSMYTVILGQPGLAPRYAGPVFSAGTGHYYEARNVPLGILWGEAKAEAEGLSFKETPGYLGAVNSQEENDFIVREIVGTDYNNESKMWLGGFQPEGSSEPDGGWQWTTGDPFSFTNWLPNQPDNDRYAGYYEDVLEAYTGRLGGWNDHRENFYGSGYLVEYDTPVVSNISRSGYDVNMLLARKPVYVDSSAAFYEDIPVDMRACPYILTASADQDATDSDFLAFDVDKDVCVYVAVDERMPSSPSWLSFWWRSAYSLETDDYSPGRKVYYRNFPAGRIELGPNRDQWMPEGMAMYSVIIGPPAPALPASVDPLVWKAYGNR